MVFGYTAPIPNPNIFPDAINPPYLYPFPQPRPPQLTPVIRSHPTLTATAQMAAETATMFSPMFLGVVRAPPLPPGAAGPVEPDRIVMMDPLLDRVMIFPSDGGQDPFSALMQEVMAMSAMEGFRGPPPASKASIQAMKTVEAAAEGECAVCLENLGGGSKEMPCGHRYHGDCIGKWLGSNGSCPICRYQMPEEEGGARKV